MFYISEMKLKRACDIRWLICILCWTLFTSTLCVNVDFKNTTTAVPPSTSPLHCSNVRHALQDERGFGDIPREPIPGDGLKVCNARDDSSPTSTCCTAKMEGALAARSRQNFDQSLNDVLSGKLSAVLRARATKFDEFFRELLATSKHEFHEMFTKTYGVIYEQNSYVFTELFDDLERYYLRGKIRLDHAMESFFSKLYQKMFTVLNGQYHFDNKYLDCVGHHMKELRPFGDVPHKLSVQVKRSFIATRTFGQALIVAADVAAAMQGVHLPPDCGRALARMSGCNVCQGRPQLRACSDFCSNVMRGCLAYHSELDTEWNAFVDSFVKISDRLLGPFNIEVVVEPINIKISEAIMNFQENGAEVSQKVFSGCGKPRLGKRSSTELHFETLRFGNNNRNRGSMHSEPTSLEKLINDTSFKVKDTKNFWSLLPLQMCTNGELAASRKQDNNCWNGQEKARYTKELVTRSGISDQANNPEVHVDSKPNNVLNEQIYSLKLLTNKLRNAYNGKDVIWEEEPDDDEDSELEASGSGSGDFSTPSSGEGHDRGRDPGPVDLESGEGSGDYNYPDPPLVHRQPAHSAPQPPSPVPPREHHPPPPQTPISPSGPTSSATPTIQSGKLVTTRAVVTYLVPIVVAWFGEMFSKW